MARLREFDYEQVLDGALQLFWRGGYEATSLDGLLNEVGLSKSSFYGAFGSKHEMLLASLDRYIDTVLKANIDDLRRGQEAGEFAADADARVLSTFLVANLYGLQLLARANIGVDARKMTLATIM